MCFTPETYVRNMDLPVKPACFSVGEDGVFTTLTIAYRRGTYLPSTPGILLKLHGINKDFTDTTDGFCAILYYRFCNSRFSHFSSSLPGRTSPVTQDSSMESDSISTDESLETARGEIREISAVSHPFKTLHILKEV